VLNRGHNREAVLAGDDDREAFLALLTRYKRRFGFLLHHYCLMGNHFHLLIRLTRPHDLSPMMAGLLRAYVHSFHRRRGFVGHLWQGRFKSPAVQREGYWLSCGRYIERNPVEAGLVRAPWDYRWSSAAAYATGAADPLVDENPCYRELAGGAKARRSRWRAFLLDADEREATVRQGEWAVGDDSFQRQTAEVHGRPTRRRGRPAKASR
jgi:putative transposase